MLSQGAVKMIEFVLNEESGHSKSFLESLQADMIFESNK